MKIVVVSVNFPPSPSLISIKSLRTNKTVDSKTVAALTHVDRESSLTKAHSQKMSIEHRRPKLTTREIDRINDLCKRMKIYVSV